MISAPNYRYDEADRSRTLKLGSTFFDLLPGGWPADPDGTAGPYRAEAERALSTLAETEPDHALEVQWQQWSAATAALRGEGTFGPTVTGTVEGLFISDGGVPKAPIDQATVTWTGVDGDRQNDRVSHGSPWQAVCLWSSEVIADLAADGHPLAAGLAGENVTITGLPWERVVPGARIDIGDVGLAVTSYAVPCKKNARWFSDGNFDRLHHRHGPRSRVYAIVTRPGLIAIGDSATLEP